MPLDPNIILYLPWFACQLSDGGQHMVVTTCGGVDVMPETVIKYKIKRYTITKERSSENEPKYGPI